jgi:uncharacterized protein YggE
VLIEQPWGITAFGQGTSRDEPDHARIRVAINRLAAEPAQALAEAKAVAAAVRTCLRNHGVTDEDVNTSRMKVHSAWDGYGAQRQFLGHQCRIEFSAQIRALDTVETCLVEVVTAGADEIVGVDYDSTRRPELRAAARREAVDLARTKATLYAEAADLKLGPIVHIEDVDPQTLNQEFGHRAPASTAEAEGDSLVPGSVAVNAAVILGFSIAR